MNCLTPCLHCGQKRAFCRCTPRQDLEDAREGAVAEETAKEELRKVLGREPQAWELRCFYHHLELRS